MELTERQIWKTMRSLVKENSNQIKQIYSGYQYGLLRARLSEGLISQTTYKSQAFGISSGIKRIYQAFGEKFTESDFEAKDTYHSLIKEGKNWLDKLSSDDLFQFFVFQNQVLDKVVGREQIESHAFTRPMAYIQPGMYFTGKIDFTGKPEKVAADKEPFDETNIQNINETLMICSQRAYEKHALQQGENLGPITPLQIKSFNFGEYTGGVAQAYVTAYEQELRALHEREKTETMVGLDEQGTPVFKSNDGQGNISYYTYANPNFTGQIFDEEFTTVVEEVGTEEEIPTGESDEEPDYCDHKYSSLFKPHSADFVQTEGSEQN